MAEGLPTDVNIEALKDSVKHEIRRELKIKEGAENLLKAAKDRKSKSQAEHIVKESSDKITFLRLKLQDLLAQVPDDEGIVRPCMEIDVTLSLTSFLLWPYTVP